MDTATILTIIGIVVAVVIGIWQIQLARKQIHLSKNQASDLTKSQNSKNGLSAKIDEQISSEEQDAINQNHPTNEGRYREQPYPGEIFHLTNQLPLIQRSEARNNYVGLRVKWRGTIQNLYLDSNNFVAFVLDVKDHDVSAYVRFKVKNSEYPELRNAKDGDGIWVYGEIKSVGNVDIELSNCRIELD
jgi:hypothetical protein